MPFASHYRLTCSGSLGGTIPDAEQFSFGVCLAKGAQLTGGAGTGGAEGALQPDQAQFDDLVADTRAFFSRPQSFIHPAAKLTTIKLAWIGADGKYTRDPMIAAVSTAGGADPTFLHPPQVALACSLVTGRRGPTGRGRFYLPMPAIAVLPTDLEISPVARDTVVASVAQWLNALGDEPGIDVLDLGVVVASTKGYNTPVTGVRVGRAFDTIRSRRRSLSEAYSATVAVSAGG